MAFVLFSSLGWGQTYFDMSAANYSQDFNAISTLPTNFSTVQVLSTGTIPIATKTTTASTSNLSVITSSTAIGKDATTSTKLVFLVSGSTDNNGAISTDLNLNFTNRNAGNLSFDASTIFNGTGNRKGTLRVYYSAGNNIWTELTGTNLPYIATNNVTASAAINISLPSELNNQATVILRFYYHNGTGGTTGSRPRIGIDNISVSGTASASTAPTVSSSAATSITTTGATLNGNVTSDGGSTVTERGFVYKTTSGATIADNKTIVSGTTGAYTLTPTLSTNTQYFYKAYAINSIDTTLSTPELSFYTLANVPNAPTVSNPTTSTLDVALGASDGNPAATEYAIQETSTNKYVQANGTLNATVVWQTAATWGTKTIIELTSSTQYTFQVKAKNGANTETSFSTSASGTTSTSTTPTISGATTAAAFTTTYGTDSAVQTFAISGVNLTAAITATAPAGFLVSADGTNYGTTATFAPSSGSVNGSLSVVLAATAGVAGTYDAQNIVLSSTGATNANIATTATGNSVAPAPLTISGLSASDKPYDRGTTVTVSGTAAFSGLKNGETFTPSGTVTWAFADRLAAIGKPVTRTGNYAVPSANYTLTQPSLTASISALVLTTTGTATVTPKTYDRTTAATLTGISLVGVISPDVVSIVGTYDTKTVNTGKPVTLVLSGADSANYSWTAPSVTGDITAATVTITGPAVTDKIIDGTNTATITGTLSGVILGDIVTLNGTGTFASSAIANGISVTSTATLSGTDAGNYTLTQPTGLTGNIIVQEAGLLLLEDNFNYSGVLTGNGWTQISTTTTNPINSGTGNGLSYANYGSSSIGNAATLSTGQDIYKTFAPQNPGSGTSTIYYSALVQISNATTNGDYFLTLGESSTFTASATFRSRIYAKRGSSISKIVFGISTNGTVSYPTTEYDVDTTILLAVKHTFTTTTSTSSLYINPSLYSEPNLVSNSDNTNSTVSVGLNSIVLRQGGSTGAPTLVIDGIRVATNWGALLGNPQYTTNYDIAAGNYNTVNVLSGAVTALGNVASKTLNIEASGSLAVTTGNNLTIDGAITNAGTLTIANNANLIQGGTTNTNSGNVIVNRDSALINLYDYTLWSSPVAGQKLKAFSPNTLNTRFYTYNSGTNLYNVVTTPLTTDFAPATGYLIRADNTLTANTPTTFNGVFTGIPNNGTVPINLSYTDATRSYNLVGNPYPSTINANAFITENTDNIESTLYFWRKINGASGSAYATYNPAGGTFTAPSGTSVNPTSEIPNGTIQVGQGFFVKAKSASTLNFKNAMRLPSISTQFFRTNTERNRIWLNLTNTSGVFSQMLVSYMADATQGVDSLDGKYINDAPVALTSIINAEEYTIQGRALPFATTDTVPLGFKTNAAGNYTIAIDHVDGLFSNGQTVFLKDNLLSTVTDLSAGSYSFASAIGTFNSRFEVVYQNTLAVTNPTFTANSVIAFSANGEIRINSGSTIMELVRVYDLQGRLLVEKKQINASETKLSTTATNQVLLVEVTAANGSKITKKIIQ